MSKNVRPFIRLKQRQMHKLLQLYIEENYEVDILRAIALIFSRTYHEYGIENIFEFQTMKLMIEMEDHEIIVNDCQEIDGCKLIVYPGGCYIYYNFITNLYFTDIEGSNYQSFSLDVIEQYLWDNWGKQVCGITYESGLADIKLRIKSLINTLFPTKDEHFQINCALYPEIYWKYQYLHQIWNSYCGS